MNVFRFLKLKKSLSKSVLIYHCSFVSYSTPLSGLNQQPNEEIQKKVWKTQVNGRPDNCLMNKHLHVYKRPAL